MAISRRNLLAAGCGTAVRCAAAQATKSGSVRIGNPHLTIQFTLTRGGIAHIPVLRNAVSGFNWSPPRATSSPLFSSSTQTDRSMALQSWKNYTNGLELVYDLTNGVSFEQRFEIVPDLPVAVCSCRVANKSADSLTDIEAAGMRIPLRADCGPMEVHCISRDSYAVQRVPVVDQLESAAEAGISPDMLDCWRCMLLNIAKCC